MAVILHTQAILKFSEIGAPSRCGCCITALSMVAAVMPPNGPIMIQ